METLRELSLSQIKVTGGMLADYQKLMVEEMVPYQMEIAKTGGELDTLRRAAGYWTEERTGPEQMSDFGKLLEAAGYSLLLREDEGLRRDVEEIVSLLRQAQLADGYLHPRMVSKRPADRFLSLLMSHEMYALGHFIEGLLACAEAGVPGAQACAEKIGDCLYERFGRGPGQICGYDGHPEVELALYRLYRATGKQEYLDVMKFFVDERGQCGEGHPHYYDWEQERNTRKFGKPVLGDLARWADRHRPYWGRYEYFQAHAPARQLTEPVGHAVRATYFYCGMADLAAETDDAELAAACRRLWENFQRGNVFLNGSIGQEGFWEGIGRAYDLPNDITYNETCAAIGLFLFAHRMLRMDPKGCYGDQMENSFYNTVLAGTGLDGRHYFYCNPLEVWLDSLYRYDKMHILSRRYEWDSVPCCPPNVARLLGEIAQFTVLAREDGLWVNLYGSVRGTAQLACGEIPFEMETRYPWEGRVRFCVQGAGRFALRFRIPAWCRKWSLRVNGETVDAPTEDGFACVERDWQPGDCAALELEIVPRRVYADPRAYHLANQVAVMRGPLLYCAEEVDNGPLLSGITLPEDAPLTERAEPDLLGGVVTVSAPARKLAQDGGPLYRGEPPRREDITLKLIPYYAWANRAEGEMRSTFYAG